MIISTEYHDLLEQFKTANKLEGAAIKELNTYMATPNADSGVIRQLMDEFEEAHETKMKLFSQLKEVSLAP